MTGVDTAGVARAFGRQVLFLYVPGALVLASVVVAFAGWQETWTLVLGVPPVAYPLAYGVAVVVGIATGALLSAAWPRAEDDGVGGVAPEHRTLVRAIAPPAALVVACALVEDWSEGFGTFLGWVLAAALVVGVFRAARGDRGDDGAVRES